MTTPASASDLLQRWLDFYTVCAEMQPEIVADEAAFKAFMFDVEHKQGALVADTRTALASRPLEPQGELSRITGDELLRRTQAVLLDETIPASNRYVRAIKEHRNLSGSTLIAAKNVVDGLRDGSIRVTAPPQGEGPKVAEPSPGLLMSMAIRYDHALGCPGYYDHPLVGTPGITHAQRLLSTLTTMRQLWEEVVGQGFYRPEKEAEYAAMAQPAGEEKKG